MVYRQDGSHTLRGRIGKVVASHASVARSIPADAALIYTMHESLMHGVLPMRLRSATSQMDRPSLTPLSVAGCGRLQLGVPHSLQQFEEWAGG